MTSQLVKNFVTSMELESSFIMFSSADIWLLIQESDNYRTVLIRELFQEMFQIFV
jgi:hypothetical protein